MFQNLRYVSTEGMPREEWLRLQTLSIGGSSMGAILGLNPYMNPLELFHFYVGDHGSLQKKDQNMAMLMGHELEPVVANLWEHWGGDEASLVANLDGGRRVAGCSLLPHVIYNPDLPYAHANVDRYIDYNHQGLMDGVLEIKTINSLAAEKYEAGLPVSYVIQLQHYLAVLGCSFGEIAVLKDGRTLEVWHVEANAEIQDMMHERATAFWDNVQQARAIWADGTQDEFRRQQHITNLEPGPDDTPAYEAFLKKRWRTGQNPDLVLKGSDETLGWLQDYVAAGDQVKLIEKRQQLAKNKLLQRLESEGADVLLHEDGSKCTFRPDKAGRRTFRPTLKTPLPLTLAA